MKDSAGNWQPAVDLTPLDPLADPLRRRQLLGGLNTAAADVLARRRARICVWGLLAAWCRPVLLAAGVGAMLAGLVLMAVPRPVVTSPTLAEAAGIPGAWVRLSEGLDTPEPELLLQLDGGRL